MRRIRSVLLLTLVLGLGGFVHAPAARTPLTVNGISCQSYGNFRFYCVADVSGGTGAYNSFDWSWDQYYGGEYVGTSTGWTYVNEIEDNCSNDGFVWMTVTVRDSNWDTASGSVGFYCSYYG